MENQSRLLSPLPINELYIPGRAGILGLTCCPGRWERDLQADIAAVIAWGASAIISLIEAKDFALLEVGDFADVLSRTSLVWIQMPIPDFAVPGKKFETAWATYRQDVHQRLIDGERIVIHCNAGLGRTGTVAGLILVESGVPAREAIRLVRAARPGSIETVSQERYIISAEPR